jgi:hypothetical protein
MRVIASEAIQSAVPANSALDCFVALLLAMTLLQKYQVPIERVSR